MLQLFKKPKPMEVIHAEFDSAQDRILDECEKILAELKIPTETQIEKKALILKDLGFVNSEVIQQAKILKEKSQKIEQKINLTINQAKTIRYFKEKYPFEKFITIDELNRICEKYHLIYAPAQNYIKDIPEKNVLEMKNCKKLEIKDRSELNRIIVYFKFWGDATKEYKDFINSNVLDKPIPYWVDIDSESSFRKYFKSLNSNLEYIGTYYFNEIKVETVNKSGLFVAAPKSHFNLEGLDKKTEYGFFNVTIQEVKDPVVFEYCKNDICRIITKWGTDDDQSYLDPILLNEILN
jgi:hypothetical protein